MPFDIFRIVLLCVTLASVLTTGNAIGQFEDVNLRAGSPDHKAAQEALDFAVDFYNHKSTEKYLYKVLTYEFEELEMIVGKEYILEAVIALTNCRKGAVQNLNDCAMEGSRRLRCHFVVLVWNRKKGLLQSICRQKP